ncbi:cya1 [Symbiodinium necroappetens]|uniref:Cya1 protein n=1 Tax=Symbiodinium necroappetens TaxID=1628268 RepID=A0A812Y7X7_9DINO|nr:cya1 [Symbiodinium necroappetens]
MLTRDKTQAGVERSDLERTLEKLGFNVAEEDEHLKGSSNPVGWNRQGGSGSGEKEFGQEKELMLALFPARKKTYKLQPQHLGLPAVLRHVFVAQEELLKRSAGGMVESSSMRVVSRSLQSITNKKPFIVFFFLLTVYILVFPDLIQILTDSDADKTLLTANTIVFFLFLFELILIVSVEGSYILSIPFVLDAVSLVSIFADTWFMAEIAVDTKSSSLTKLARSSRIARIARIGRVARVTKLIPRVLKLCRKQSNALAEQLLLRRLWRLFQYLDTARDGKLSVFDLKIFYLALLQECPHVRPDKSDVVKMLEKDSELLLSCGQDESGHVNELSQILRRMAALIRKFHATPLICSIFTKGTRRSATPIQRAEKGPVAIARARRATKSRSTAQHGPVCQRQRGQHSEAQQQKGK